LADIVVKCVSNEDSFANEVFDYLYSELEKQANLEQAKNLLISTRLVRLVPDASEIEIDGKARVPSRMIKWMLERLLKLDPSRFKDYGVIQFGDTFIVSKIVQATEMGIYSCELCSYSTLYEEELYRHRILHAGFG
jgi:hypothetical protein